MRTIYSMRRRLICEAELGVRSTDQVKTLDPFRRELESVARGGPRYGICPTPCASETPMCCYTQDLFSNCAKSALKAHRIGNLVLTRKQQENDRGENQDMPDVERAHEFA
ncbi:MAG TPA: hypothetical protein VKR31_01135 [Rhizomicrobium sp.]|nr:hypothetical protein [Rhizomicrobium sp.]